MCSHPCKSFCNTKVPELLLLLFPFFIYIKLVQKHIDPTLKQSSTSIKSVHQNSNHTHTYIKLYHKPDFRMSDNNNTQQPKQGGGGFFGGITNAAGGLASGVGGVASGTVNTVGGVVGNVGRGVGKTLSDASSGLENTAKGAGGSINDVTGAKSGQQPKK
ncbi:hypothetical protein D6C97_04632 [Aureobasidium pullulans]|nr:hypothetical protein D6D04_09660 [Aureobasidium pullulans]THY57806.1 hypothetical protein D6C97_04632 [Aureobasidium pullulans]